jgi:inhibitor of KinA sporulation pathway (predicted exonuclease)
MKIRVFMQHSQLYKGKCVATTNVIDTIVSVDTATDYIKKCEEFFKTLNSLYTEYRNSNCWLTIGQWNGHEFTGTYYDGIF